MKIKKVEGSSVLSLIVTFLSIFWIIPLFLILLNSFKPYNEIINNFIGLPSSLSFEKYIETWIDFHFPQLFFNTFQYTVLTVAGITIFAPMAAYKLSRTGNALVSKFLFGLIIIPMMVPFQAYMISLTKFAANLHFIGTKHGYIFFNIGLCMPLAVFMIHGFVKNIPFELEESARMDGASSIRIYAAIIYPLLTPIISTIVIIDALATWNDVIINQLIVGSRQSLINIQNALYMKFSMQTSDWEHALPGIVLSSLPSILFFIALQKKIVGGLTSGAVKG